MRKIFILSLIITALLHCDTLFVSIEIPVRTGDSLAADVYSIDTTVAKPVILIQTPYDKSKYRYSSLSIDPTDTMVFWDLVHYNFVVVDWRGFYASSDAGSTGYDRGLDGYDCVEWIAERVWCDGNIGTYGGSALGDIQFRTARHHPPHLICAAPWIKDYKTQYSYYYYGGDYCKEHTESLQSLGFLSTDLILAHPYFDYFWIYAESVSDYPEDFNIPMFLLTGWFDHYPSDVIRAFHDIRTRSDISVRNAHKLMVGPWTHCGVGKLVQGELEFPDAEDADLFPVKEFFNYYLRGIPNGWDSEPAGMYFIMGTNEWIYTDEDWDSLAEEFDTLYFHSDGSLSAIAPPSSSPADSFIYDPKNPSPAYGGNRFNPFDPYLKIGPYDIRDSIEARDDNLIFSTDVLSENITVVGKPAVRLYVSSNRFDTDFAVRLCDVYPDGRSIIVGQGIRRARFRYGFSESDIALMNPDSIYPIDIELFDLGLTFLAGHRIRIVITSAIYPMFDINLNNGDSMYVEGDTLVATNFIYHDETHPSRIIFPTSSITATAENNIEMPKDLSINVSPNPFNSSCAITLSSHSTRRCGINPESSIEMEIYNLRGNVVYKSNLSDQQGSDISQSRRAEWSSGMLVWTPDKSISSGIYFVRATIMQQATSVVCTKRIVYLK